MIDPKKIEQIARQVHESMPKGIREFGDDVEKKSARRCRRSWFALI